MTVQPTDHRAEADKWLRTAATSVEDGAEGFAQAEALIGIGHALLAGLPPDLAHLATYRVGAHEFTNPEYARMEEYAQGVGLGAYRPLNPTLDELLPTIPADQVPTGATLYAPSGREVLAYVSGKWHRKGD